MEDFISLVYINGNDLVNRIRNIEENYNIRTVKFKTFKPPSNDYVNKYRLIYGEEVSDFNLEIKEDTLIINCMSTDSIIRINGNLGCTEYCYGLFSGFESLENIDLSNLDTSRVKDMSYMFYECKSLQSIDLSSLDTSDVRNMASMFEGCESLISLDLYNFNTLKVDNMSSMFYCCTNLVSLNINNFDLTSVNDLSNMFGYCTSLVNAEMDKLCTTQNKVDTQNMFEYCQLLYQDIVITDTKIWEEYYKAKADNEEEDEILGI